MKLQGNIKSFTLVELLIVIAILAVLAAAVVIVLNPAELLAQARDTQRVSDIKNTKSAIDLFIVDNPTISMGDAQTIYLSLPDVAAPLCTNNLASLPTLPAGWSYRCATAANLKNIDGTGWLPLDFTQVKGGSPMPYIPIDPDNNVASGRYYTYVPGGSYELTALLEAKKHDAAINDGGSLPGVYQAGSHIDLTPTLRDQGLVGKWSMNEAGGTVAYDSSGFGNNGNISGAVWTSAPSCKRESCLYFDGVDDRVEAGSGQSMKVTGGDFSVCGWANFGAGASSLLDVIMTGGNFAFRADNITRLNLVKYGVVDQYYSRTFSTDTWYFLCAVQPKGANVAYYVDGVQVGSYSNTQPLNGSVTSITLGYQGSGHQMNGYLDEISLYSRSLSATEIKILYDATK